eukprot:8756264-Pyramimonas_sp.AAC.1
MLSRYRGGGRDSLLTPRQGKLKHPPSAVSSRFHDALIQEPSHAMRLSGAPVPHWPLGARPVFIGGELRGNVNRNYSLSGRCAGWGSRRSTHSTSGTCLCDVVN